MPSSAARPLVDARVAGVLGDRDEMLARKLARSLPRGAHRVVSTAAVEFHSAIPVISTGEGRICWNPLARSGDPATWQAASQNWLAAGLDMSGERPVLHSCGWGLQELYFREIGSAVYFCDRIDPLVELDGAQLHPDWDAWASIFTFGGPQGEDTPFREVRRVRAASAISMGPRGVIRSTYEPSWLNVEPRAGAISPGDVVAQLEALMPSPGLWDPPVDVTLSGGWDSRLLAAAASRRRRRRTIRSWTTSTDDGIDDDVDLAAPVAKALGLKHHVVIPGPRAWLEHRSALLERVQFQTWMHTWSLPLADRIRDRSGPLLDGLAGDVLFKDSFVTQEVLEGTDPDASAAALAVNLKAGRGSRPNTFTAEANSWLTESSLATFLAVTADYRGHPQEIVLDKLAARTTRSIAASPLLVFGPERDVRLPFLDPGIVESAMTVPIAEKLGGAYYRRLLEASTSAEVASLPSTNDEGERPKPHQRRQSSPEAVAELARIVLTDDVAASLLDPRAVDRLTDPSKYPEFNRWSGQLVAAQSLAVLAAWRARYRNRLASSSGPV